MVNLSVLIEIDGSFVKTGTIVGENFNNAKFEYADEYIQKPWCKPISISLPLEKKKFTEQETKNYFDGLLPEGFTRKSISKAIHAAEDDYITILKNLGAECLGAVKIIDNAAIPEEPGYELLTIERIKELAEEGASKSAAMVVNSHVALTGASGKVGLYYDKKTNRWFSPKGDAPSTHIVKQSHVKYENIIINEQLCLLTAKKLGIKTPESFIIETGIKPEDRNTLFATKRYDRSIDTNSKTIKGLAVPYRLHQEDFSQALGIPAYQKYEEKGGEYLKKMFDLLRYFSADPIQDRQELWKICILNYLIGNTDNHIKNVSLLYNRDLSSVRLAPVYDVICSTLYKNTSEEMALSINGKYRIKDIGREDFRLEARHVGLNPAVAINVFDELSDKIIPALKESAEELSAKGFSQAIKIAGKISESIQ